MKRPDGITLASIFHFVAAGLDVVGICVLIALPFVLSAVARFRQDVQVSVPIGTAAAVFGGILLLLLAVADAATGWGLWRLRPWARLSALVLACLRLLNVPIGTAIGALILWYLFQPQAQEAFGEGAGVSE